MKSNNKIKLLALDVDGTLFDNTGHIPEQNIKAIKKAQEAGVTVVVASGRDYDGVPHDQLKEVAISDHYKRSSRLSDRRQNLSG